MPLSQLEVCKRDSGFSLADSERKVHFDSVVIDLHADTLLWNDDLTKMTRRQEDIPKLVKGGVDVQLWSVVTDGFPVVDGFGLFKAIRGWPNDRGRGISAACNLHWGNDLQRHGF